MSFTPSITINDYLLNSGSTTIPVSTLISSGTLDGYGDKYIYNIIVDPFHSGTIDVDTHELVFNLIKNSGNEYIYLAPITNAYLTGLKSRLLNFVSGGFISYEWVSGITSGSINVDIDSGFEGSGSQRTIIVPNSGTSWIPPYGVSGSTVIDVPTIFMGSMVGIVQPTDWDGDTDHYLHDFQMIQVHVGHQVEVAGTNLNGGKYYNNVFGFPTHGSGSYYLNARVYHEFAKEWEFYSGSTLLQSGTITPTTDTWKFIDGLSINRINEDFSYYLKLYGSGNITHPTPLRTIEITILTEIVTQSGRFDIGRFGVARFGKT